jgi:thiamine transport system permease protein
MAAILVFAAALSLVFVSRPDFFIGDLSSVYFSLLTRSVLFSLAQATASVVLSVVGALFVGYAVSCIQGPRLRALGLELLRTLGLALFFAPTLVAALSYLKWASWFDGLPKFGWVPIIFVHASLNVLFLGHVFGAVMIREFHSAQRTFEVAQVYGLPKLQWYLLTLLRPLREELLRWMPLIFWWAFSAFTTVLVLGGGPKYSSPEVLLFYLIGAGDSPARLLVLILFQVLIGYLALSFAYRKKLKPQAISQQLPSSEQSFTLPARGFAEKLVAWLGGLVACVAVLFWLPAFMHSAESFLESSFGEISAPLMTSLSLIWRSLLISTVATLLGLFVFKRPSRPLSFSMLLSPMILVAIVVQSSWFASAGEGLRLWITSALCSWSTLPLLALWVFSKHEDNMAQSRDIIGAYAPGPRFRFKFIVLPALALPLLSYIQILFLTVLGDVGVASSILGSENPSLAQVIYGQVSAYQFDAAFSMFGFLVLSMLPVWAVLVVMRLKNEERRV